MRHAAALITVAAALLGLAFLMPGHYLPWLSFQSQWVAAFGAAVFGVGAAGAAVSARHAPSVPPLALLAFATAAVPLLQHAAGQVVFFSDALLPALYLAAFGLSVVAGASLDSALRDRALDALVHAIGGAAVLSVAVALLQWTEYGVGGLLFADLPPGAQPFANLGQANHFATLSALGAVSVWRAWERRRLGAGVALLLTGWLGFGLVMAQSRTGALLAVLLALWALWQRRRGRARVPVAATLALLAALALGFAAWDALNETLRLTRIVGLADRLQPGPRSAMWRAFADAVAQAPWFGYGWNQVTLAQQATAIDHPSVQRMSQNAHSVLLDLALWAGVPLALVWTAAVGRWLWQRARAAAGPDATAVVAAVAAVLVHALLEYPLDHAYFLLPVGLLIGLGHREDCEAPATSRRAGVLPGVSLGLAAVAMLGMLVWIGAEYLRVEQSQRDVRLLLAGIGIKEVPSVPPPDVVLLDVPREYHRFMVTPARPGLDAGTLDWMRDVSQRNAYPPAMLRYALAAGLNGRAAEAGTTLKRLCAMHVPVRCEEARTAWAEAQRSYPALAGIPAP